MKCRYMSLVYNDLTHFDLRCVVFSPAIFSAGRQIFLVAFDVFDFDVFIMLLNDIHFYIAKKLHYINKIA